MLVRTWCIVYIAGNTQSSFESHFHGSDVLGGISNHESKLWWRPEGCPSKTSGLLLSPVLSWHINKTRGFCTSSSWDFFRTSTGSVSVGGQCHWRKYTSKRQSKATFRLILILILFILKHNFCCPIIIYLLRPLLQPFWIVKAENIDLDSH